MAIFKFTEAPVQDWLFSPEPTPVERQLAGVFTQLATLSQRQRAAAYDDMLIDNVGPDGKPLAAQVTDNLMVSTKLNQVEYWGDVSAAWQELRQRERILGVIGTSFYHGIAPAQSVGPRAIFVAHMFKSREASMWVRPLGFPLLIVNEIADSKGHMPDAARAEYVKARNALLMAEKPKSPLN